MSGATVGRGRGVEVPVGGGGTSGMLVAEGVTVGPMGIGIPLQAVNANAITNPNKIRIWFMEVLILVK
jgi:hypothetical protein